MQIKPNVEFPKEWERKFLVISGSWREEVIETHNLIQGYFSRLENCRIRIRIFDDGRAILTFKGRKDSAEGFSRTEVEGEYVPIKGNVAHILLMCDAGYVVKTRHLIRHGMPTQWKCYVDEFDFGLTMAEIETDQPEESFYSESLPELPSWIGREVTKSSLYKNVHLAQRTITDVFQAPVLLGLHLSKDSV